MNKLNRPKATVFASLFLLCATLPLLAQKKAQKTAKPTRIASPLGMVRILSDKEADALVKRVRKLVLSKKAKKRVRRRKKGAPPKINPLITRLDEVDELSLVHHAKLVPLLKRVIKTDPSDVVRAKAAYALQAQPKKLVLPLATKLLEDRDIRRSGSIAGPLIAIMTFHGAPPRAFEALHKRFLDLGSSAQIAVMESIGKRKDWGALGLLLTHLDPPQPVNVDDPSNPPAAYWKKRWEAWATFSSALKISLKTLIGKSFAKRQDAVKYIDSQGGLKKLRKKRGG